MSEALCLLLAQVDDAPGELLGEFMRRVEEAGARNVHLVPTLAKKGRPGYLIYIDVPADREHDVALLLASELGCWGYRVLSGEHRHFDIARTTIAVIIEAAGARHPFELRVKTIGTGALVLRVKAEHDDLAAICRALGADGIRIPLAVLKASVESRWREAGFPAQLSLSI